MAVYAEFVTTEGNFTIRLFDQEAPNTVANFVGLAEGTKEWTDPRTNQKVTEPYYDGIIFHRVIDGFMIQGGDPLGKGIGGPGYKFADEFHPSLRHSKPGILSMANRGRTPTAVSSSSRWRRRRISTTPLGLRRGREWHGRRAQDRQHRDRAARSAAQGRGDQERQDRRRDSQPPTPTPKLPGSAGKSARLFTLGSVGSWELECRRIPQNSCRSSMTSCGASPQLRQRRASRADTSGHRARERGVRAHGGRAHAPVQWTDALPRHRRAVDAADPRSAGAGTTRAQTRRRARACDPGRCPRGAGQDQPGFAPPDQNRQNDIDVLALDEALRKLAELDAALARIVELRYFGGLTVEETAEVVGVSPATVKRQWTLARAWLKRALEGATSPEMDETS